MVTGSFFLASYYELIQLEDIKCLLFSDDFKTYTVFTCLSFPSKKAQVSVRVCNNFKVWYCVNFSHFMCDAKFFSLTIYIYAFTECIYVKCMSPSFFFFFILLYLKSRVMFSSLKTNISNILKLTVRLKTGKP